MTDRSPEDIATRMEALGLWAALAPYNFVVKPRGTALPYFCTVMLGGGHPAVSARFVMLEGWQTCHDFVNVRADESYGFYTSPIEMAHYELVYLKDGGKKIFRHDPCFMPHETDATQRALVSRILWQAYGVMMRLETEPKLPLKFMDERAMFGRLETGDGVWEDHAFLIPPARPPTEKVVVPTATLKAAKDLPLVAGDVLDVDMRILPYLATAEKRPRTVFGLVGVVPSTGEKAINVRCSPEPEGGLRALWETMPGRILEALVRRGRIPGEIRCSSGRVFRLLRPLCMDLPFKLTLKSSLPELERAYVVRT